jgi:hypothetical protein
MWLDSRGQEAVNLFWQRCGEIEPFPRNLERSIALALPVTLVKLPYPKLRHVERWLRCHGVTFQFNCQSRTVRGCLIAFGGEGFIFVDGADPDDERRFTLAHEIAHFIADYWQPRQKAIMRFGSTITEVLDGLRLPNVNERLFALLAGTPIGVHIDLMERGNVEAELWEIESRADKIALALLAPPEAVLSEVDLSATRFDQRQATTAAVLRERFGLSASIAKSYGHSLLTAIGKGPSWVENIRLR